MIDITSVGERDLRLVDTQTGRAANLLSVQIASLAYAPTVGIDLKYFLDENFSFQNESFKSYLVQVLANFSINVASIDDTIENLARHYNFNLTPAETDGALVSR